MLDLFGARTAVRTWCVQCPPGMLAHGKHQKTFSSVAAFDGYVCEVRARGFVVSFVNPFLARVALADS